MSLYYNDDLIRQLDLLSFLSQRKGSSAEALAEHLRCSVPTVKRDVPALRHLGADIISDRLVGYRLMNWPQIRGTVRAWRERELKRQADLDAEGLLKRMRVRS